MDRHAMDRHAMDRHATHYPALDGRHAPLGSEVFLVKLIAMTTTGVMLILLLGRFFG